MHIFFRFAYISLIFMLMLVHIYIYLLNLTGPFDHVFFIMLFLYYNSQKILNTCLIFLTIDILLNVFIIGLRLTVSVFKLDFVIYTNQDETKLMIIIVYQIFKNVITFIIMSLISWYEKKHANPSIRININPRGAIA